MKVPLLDLKEQLKGIEKELKEALNEVVDSTRYVLGPKVEELETRIARYVGTDYAVGVSSGTDALLISMMAMEVGRGDIVITTPYSFFSTVGAVARLNATPAFVDIDEETYNMSTGALEAWFSRNKGKIDRVKAIVPVHLYGQCADMDPILSLADMHGVTVLEDSAQAIGASYPSTCCVRRAGSMGAAGCLSFYPTKNLGGIGDGGMVVTKDGELARRVAVLRNHGAERKYNYPVVGGNFRLDPIQAAALLVKLPHLEAWHDKRRKHASYYDEHLGVDGIDKPAIAYSRENHIYHQYVISVRERRDELRRFLDENEIGNEVYYPVPLHEQNCFKRLGYRKGSFPCSERAARHSLALPVYPELTRKMQDYVIEKISRFYS